MNAALFMLSTAWMAGADVAVTPAPIAPGSPAVVSTGSSCGGGGCATACDDGCASKPGFFARCKAKLGCGHKSACADACATPCAAPVIHQPAPVAYSAPVSSCGTCNTGCGKPGLFSRLKGGCGHKSACNTGCGSSACGSSGCGSSVGYGDAGYGNVGTSTVPGPITTPGAHPEVIPPPKKTEKAMPQGGTTGITIEPVLTPVAAPRPIDLNGQKNPF